MAKPKIPYRIKALGKEWTLSKYSRDNVLTKTQAKESARKNLLYRGYLTIESPVTDEPGRWAVYIRKRE